MSGCSILNSSQLGSFKGPSNNAQDNTTEKKKSDSPSLFKLPDDIPIEVTSIFLSPTELGPLAETSKAGKYYVAQTRLITTSLKISPKQNIQKVLNCYKNGNLKTLDLYATTFTDNDVSFIAQNFPNIQSLNLGDGYSITNLTDTGLASLSNMPLQYLNLQGCTKITDDGLASLSNMPLQYLNLQGCTQITGAGLASLAKKLSKKFPKYAIQRSIL